jgi:tripartite-type tricarboxylate transporter receptor subunit TctC
MRKLLIAVALAAVCATWTNAAAQTYPSRPVTIIVPFPAGGPTDTVARILGEHMKGTLGQPIVVENVAGAGASIGITRAVQAAPDGYTTILGNWTSHVGAGAIYPVNWNILTDLAPIARLSISTLIMFGKNDLPAKDIRELIAWMKANPGKASVATIGPGSGAHVCGIYFQDKTGTNVQYVPYRGGAPVMQDLIAGQIDLFCGEASQALSQVRGGKVKAFVTFSPKRWGPLPDVPTMAEIAGADINLDFWHGLWAPKGTPKEAIDKLNAAVVSAFADATVKKRIADLGQTIPPREQLTPAALATYHKAEVDKWWPIIKGAGIKAN